MPQALDQHIPSPAIPAVDCTDLGKLSLSALLYQVLTGGAPVPASA